MPHGPQPGSIGELCESQDGQLQRQGEAATRKFAQLICVQLVILALFVAAPDFAPPMQRWLERSENDACMRSTQVMTCLDWGLNGLLFFVLVPLTFLTVRVRNPLFRWALWAAFSLTLVLDVGLFLAAASWRKYAAATCTIAVGFLVLLAVISHFPKTARLISWTQAYNYGVMTGLAGGMVLVVVLREWVYGYVALAASLVNFSLLFCCKLILDWCPPDQAPLGSMFLLFPEGLPFALMILRRGTEGGAGPRAGLGENLVECRGDSA